MILYALSICLSAFLLFQIEPIITKTLLPWFGGTTMVWSSAMLFFQIMLVAGYAYSNWLVRRGNPRLQYGLHLGFLCISAVLMLGLWLAWPSPVTPAPVLIPQSGHPPLPDLFFLLAISIGLPFFLLSTNNSLMQAWQVRQEPARSPYGLYALSNAASILGLLVYPFLVEPALTLSWQGRSWAIGYLIFVILAAAITIRAARRGSDPLKKMPAGDSVEKPVHGGTKVLWLLLSGCGALMMLAVTNQLTQEVAPIPFLWVLPLAIYLLSFVLAFSGRRWYRRRVFVFLLTMATAAWFIVSLSPGTDFKLEIVVYSFLLFTAAMLCHGELFTLRPPASRLALYYLLIAIGGALGGMFVSLLAPVLFQGYWELHFGVALAWILLAVRSREGFDLHSEYRASVWVVVMAVLTCLNLVLLVYYSLSENDLIRRNFYGVVAVRDRPIGPEQEVASLLVHGTTIHGYQFLAPEYRELPTAYYSYDSGVGKAILANPHYGRGMRVGVLGLGVGTLAAYAQPGDVYRFYEINPAVIDLARGQEGFFSFLADSQAAIEIVPGDARLSLARERDNDFDLLVLDTFSSDAIPTHLVTREAFAIYLDHLAPDGLIAAHITNSRLDLRPLFWQLAQAYDLEFTVVENPAEWQNMAALPSTWVLLARDPALFEAPGLAGVIEREADFRKDLRLWTDDYSNLLPLVK